MRAVILQSNYIPWKGYFDLIAEADIFIFYDDVQYTKQDWRNRNQIKTHQGIEWLSIPIGTPIDQLICEVEFPNQDWKQKHQKTIAQNYQKAPFFSKEILDNIYDNSENNLSRFNQNTIKYLSKLLKQDTKFDDSRNYQLKGEKTDRLMDLLQQVGATSYLSGPSGKNYLEEEKFNEFGIQLEYFDYSDYLEYAQLYGAFTHQVSLLDLIFNTGEQATKYLKSDG